MISSLLGSELDLKAYIVEDFEKENDAQQVQTDAKEESAEDDEEEEEDDSPDDDDQIQVNVEKKADSQFGRDKNGMFKNHKNYMKLRNKINE